MMHGAASIVEIENVQPTSSAETTSAAITVEFLMAKNSGDQSSRGIVAGRTHSEAPSGHFQKGDQRTGHFMEYKKSSGPFKGVSQNINEIRSKASENGDTVISVGEPLPKLTHHRILSNRLVQIVFQSGESRTVDLAPVLSSRKLFAPLVSDDTLFHQVAVNEDGNALEWPGGIELSAIWISQLPDVA